jgi:hypothetical protein
MSSIDEMNDRVKKMNQKQEKLFEELGLSEHQIHHFMNDPERLAPASKERIEAQSRELESFLDRLIEETQKPAKTQKPSPLNTKAGQHWISVR